MSAETAGRVLAGKYRLVDKLAEGGMGAVWRAEHVTLHSQLAIKLVKPSALDADEGLRRFSNEAQAAARLRSPHVVQILDHGVDDGVPYIAMELLDGESLAARLTRAGRLSIAETARIVSHVCRAVAKAHEAGIIHRDLKPDNVFLVHNDDETIAKVLDFGIAKVAHALAEAAHKPNTRTGALLGTPFYMSPEQVRGHKIDHRTDLWAIAVIAFQCLVGRLPFDGETVGDLLLQICTSEAPVPSTLAPLPRSFDAWFAKGVARPLEARFQSAREMADALRVVSGNVTGVLDSSRFSIPDEATPPPMQETIDASSQPGASSARAGEIGHASTVSAGIDRAKLETSGGGSSVDARSADGERRAPSRGRSRWPLAAAGAGLLCVVAWLGVRWSAPAASPDAAPIAAPAPTAPSPPAPAEQAAATTEAPIASNAPPSPEVTPAQTATAEAAPSTKAAAAKPPARRASAPKPPPSAATTAAKKKDELAF